MATQVSNRDVILLDMNVLFIMHIIKSKEGWHTLLIQS